MAAVYPGDFLKVENRSSEPITLTWDGRSVTAAPGKVALATFEQVVNTFGHPGAGEEGRKVESELGAFHFVPTRKSEAERVSVKNAWDLGVSTAGGALQSLRPVPDIRIFTQDNERVYTVAEDPAGAHQMSLPSQARVDTADQIKRLEHQLAALQAQVRGDALDLSVPDAISPDEGTDAPRDE